MDTGLTSPTTRDTPQKGVNSEIEHFIFTDFDKQVLVVCIWVIDPLYYIIIHDMTHSYIDMKSTKETNHFVGSLSDDTYTVSLGKYLSYSSGLYLACCVSICGWLLLPGPISHVLPGDNSLLSIRLPVCQWVKNKSYMSLNLCAQDPKLRELVAHTNSNIIYKANIISSVLYIRNTVLPVLSHVK